jgi:hypothetical protein
MLDATEKAREKDTFLYSTDIWYLIYLEYSHVLSGRKMGGGGGGGARKGTKLNTCLSALRSWLEVLEGASVMGQEGTAGDLHELFCIINVALYNLQFL